MFSKKLSFIYGLLLLLAVMQAHAGNSLQDALDKKISIELKNVILKDALEKISNLAEVSFVYIGNEVLDANKVSVNAHNEKVGDLLNKLLTPYSLSYSVMYDRVVIKHDNGKKPAPLTVTGTLLHITVPVTDVKGVVTNEKKEFLPGVSIIIKGTSRGVTTNDKGVFELKKIANDAILYSILPATKQKRSA